MLCNLENKDGEKNTGWLNSFFQHILYCFKMTYYVTCHMNETQEATTNIRFQHTDCPPKKLQSAFGYRLQENPLWNQKNQTGL